MQCQKLQVFEMPSHRPSIVLPLIYCRVDKIYVFEVGPVIQCSDVELLLLSWK